MNNQPAKQSSQNKQTLQTTVDCLVMIGNTAQFQKQGGNFIGCGAS
jgi:hypothetical protein